jgi:hypothetical protein
MKFQNLVFTISVLALIGCETAEEKILQQDVENIRNKSRAEMSNLPVITDKPQLSTSEKRMLPRTAYHLNSLGDTIQVYPKVILNNTTWDKGDWLQDSTGDMFYITGGILILK